MSDSKSANRSPVVTTSAVANSTSRRVLRRTSQTVIAAGAQSADTLLATASAHRIPANTARRGVLRSATTTTARSWRRVASESHRIPRKVVERGRARQNRRNDHQGDVGRRPASSRGDIHQHVERDIDRVNQHLGRHQVLASDHPSNELEEIGSGMYRVPP